MVGTSIRSDVLPVTEIGRVINVPYEITWEHEHIKGDLPEGAVIVAKLLDLLDTDTANHGENRT